MTPFGMNLGKHLSNTEIFIRHFVSLEKEACEDESQPQDEQKTIILHES